MPLVAVGPISDNVRDGMPHDGWSACGLLAAHTKTLGETIALKRLHELED